MSEQEHEQRVPEIAITGDLTEHESELTNQLLDVEPGGACTLYFDSPGGSPYCAMSLMTLIRLRGLRATGIVTGECSSAALWPFAACERRMVTAYSVLLFHPMKWQSEESVGLSEAAEWARHFGQLEKSMDELLADLFGVSREVMAGWINPGRYISGSELAGAGLAELISTADIAGSDGILSLSSNGVSRNPSKPKLRQAP
ncbi:MAG: ATP-dependent Clp protease proteolytic subunit [Planctomycetales bacterium]|nr:ATP-dependent Clp protease proteolytic subunit [Planctomycetales bacterium]